MKQLAMVVTLGCAICLLPGISVSDVFPTRKTPCFDPMPHPLPGGSTSSSVVSSIDRQIWVLNWLDYARYEAIYNAQDQIASQLVYYWNDALPGWDPFIRMEFSYRPDGRPLHVDWFENYNQGWYLWLSGNWCYESGRLASYCLNEFTDGSDNPFLSFDFSYDEQMGRVDRVTESYYFVNPVNPYMNASEYQWDAQGRPSVVLNYNKQPGSTEWQLGSRWVYEYHPADQTTYQQYLRLLEFCYPFDPRLVAGVNPVLLLRESYQHPYSQDWGDVYYIKYLYHPDLRLDMKQTWMVMSSSEELHYQVEYGYEDGLLNRETFYTVPQDRHTLEPNERLFYEYTELVANDDDNIPDPILQLTLNPNPFTNRTMLSYELKQPGAVSIRIYNLKGQLVRCLDEVKREAGKHTLEWDGKDNQGRRLDNGIYLLQMISGETTRTAKAILLK